MKSVTKIIALATLGLAILAGCSNGPSREEQQKLADLQAALDAKEAQAKEASKRVEELAEAKRLAEESAKSAREAESARLAELAAQVERDKQEKARLNSLVSDLKSKTDSIAANQLQMQEALAKARKDRELQAIEAARKVKAAQNQLAAAEAQKQAEIQAAREAALAEALKQMQERARKGGYTAATDVITDHRKESINAFLAVEIAERNFRNNTRRTDQRREAGD